MKLNGRRYSCYMCSLLFAAVTLCRKAADTSCFQAWWAAGRPISDTQIKWHRGHTRDRLKWPELYQHFCKVNELVHGSTKHKRTCWILAVRATQVVMMDFNCRFHSVTQVLRLISWARTCFSFFFSFLRTSPSLNPELFQSKVRLFSNFYSWWGQRWTLSNLEGLLYRTKQGFETTFHISLRLLTEMQTSYLEWHDSSFPVMIGHLACTLEGLGADRRVKQPRISLTPKYHRKPWVGVGLSMKPMLLFIDLNKCSFHENPTRLFSK